MELKILNIIFTKKFKFHNLPLSFHSYYAICYQCCVIFLLVVTDPDEKAFFNFLILAGLSTFSFQDNA